MIAHVLRLLFLAAFAAPLLGASGGFGNPVVVVYPITTTGGTEPAAGGNIALLMATRIAQLGGVDVKPAIPGTERPKFLDAALAVGADYYISGFLTPLGGDNSLVTQVVSTQTGSVVFATTTSVRTYADAAAQADSLRDAILRHAGRALASIGAQPAATPAPVANGGNVNLTKALRKRKQATASGTSNATPSSATATATPAPAPSTAPRTSDVVHPSTAGLLFQADGALDDRTRGYATNAIARALRRDGIEVGTLAVPLGDALVHAHAICAATPGTSALYAASVVVGNNETTDPSAQVDVTAYDCNGTRTASHRALGTAKRGGIDGALDAAANAVASAFAQRR